MENYVGCKLIKAEKVKFSKYLEIKYGKDYKYTGNQDLNKDVYVIVYPPIGDDEKPYISMSPPKVFEKAYRKVEPAELSLMYVDNDKNHLLENEADVIKEAEDEVFEVFKEDTKEVE